MFCIKNFVGEIMPVVAEKQKFEKRDKTSFMALSIFWIHQDCDAEMRMEKITIKSAAQSDIFLLQTMKEYNSLVMEKNEFEHRVSTRIKATFYFGYLEFALQGSKKRILQSIFPLYVRTFFVRSKKTKLKITAKQEFDIPDESKYFDFFGVFGLSVL